MASRWQTRASKEQVFEGHSPPPRSLYLLHHGLMHRSSPHDELKL